MSEMDQHDLAQLERSFIQMKRRMDSEWSKGNYGLNALQGRILFRLFEDGPQKASALAEQLYITPGAVTGIADKLLEMELIERDRAEDDRRVVILSATEAGGELAQKLREKRRAVSEKMFSGLSSEDVRELTRLFDKINQNMDAANAQEHEE
ncbi:MarR family winged helix-turn-helix transcriptional regulator [Paenibacillus mendelii]|uniref:MarR family winged helix-turn-helix transcriptional regulator n=1 Tax=Paenibacillus mendelii TaxID=206163 RepID=A0ABV6JB81_9BACL|nr:MarR family transcriptional regulator [Paenibacillus mendelii]MCQ6558494.1 MarR family transcriptional regulator [Paenibacillus mendelii]